MSILQEAILFNIVSSIVAQDLKESFEEFHWKSFEILLDVISDQLIQCHDQEANATILAGHEVGQDFEFVILSSSFLSSHKEGSATVLVGHEVKGSMISVIYAWVF